MRAFVPSTALLSLLPALSLAAVLPRDSAQEATATSILAQTPTQRPTAISEVLAIESAIWSRPTPRKDLYDALASQVAAGVGPFNDTVNGLLTGAIPSGENSIDNKNPDPPSKVYPRVGSSDAAYTLSEAQLRKALFIPKGFTWGQKQPVLFVPGSASYGGNVFASNLRKLLTGKPYADPVWLNVPGALLNDAQTNAEYIAYAIQYLSSFSTSAGGNGKISVITWSQGGLITQWVLKYFPSTRSRVGTFFPVAADFDGSVLANVFCLSAFSNIALAPCPPAVFQQQATSDLVRVLRRNGGDSAYVPTTSFFSATDEIVQPQSGTLASAFLKDNRNVGVTNIEFQEVCKGNPGGGFYGHAGSLFHPLAGALIVDALTNGGPAQLGRIDVEKECGRLAAQGF